MKYYKVLPEYDNERRYKFARGGGLEIDSIYIKNELYTQRELLKYLGYSKYVIPVEIPKSKIYFFFGRVLRRRTKTMIIFIALLLLTMGIVYPVALITYFKLQSRGRLSVAQILKYI